ncbi:hypothetical protein EON62_06505 [archaeon]|nr:MAG: hypothetical protein EON62_06505 [archaeon]
MLMLPRFASLAAARMATTLIRGGVARTRAACRPAPSLFTYPGLTSRPFHPAQSWPALAAMATALPEIRREYVEYAARHGQDYTLRPDEATLHTGAWDWHSAVVKGEPQEAFQLYVCCRHAYRHAYRHTCHTQEHHNVRVCTRMHTRTL